MNLYSIVPFEARLKQMSQNKAVMRPHRLQVIFFQVKKFQFVD